MAGYQRFVAYVYEYRKGKKDSSSGYVRVEARDRKCRVEVHLRCVGLEPGSRCRVYGFVRQEGLMDGILIGSCVTGRERIECALETDTGDIGGMGKSLQELGGLLLISDAGGFWGTEWDDQPIRPENFREWKKKETESRKETEKTGTEYQKAAEKTGREREEKEEENQKDGTLPEVQENQKESDRIMTVEEIQEDVLKTSETGNSYQAPGPHPPEPLRPGQPSPHPPEPPRPGQPSPHPPELPRPGQPSPHPPKPSRPEPSVHFREYPVMIPLTTAISQTAARSDHRTAVPYAEKTAASAATVLSCTDIRISAIFCCAEIPGDSTYWEYPVDTASRNGLWPICLAFPTLRNVRIFISQAEREDTGTVLLTSDQKNFGIHADKQTVLQIRRSQLHTTNFYYRDRLRQDIPVVFHFFLGAGRESRYQNSVGIPISLEIISFCTA